MADGRIVDRGTHEELLRRNPAYASLVNAYEDAAATEVAGR
jgi:ABC-type multidrug transport system fused ATPase/permease subunit